MEELRQELIKLINEEESLNERVLKVSEELDKLIVEYYYIKTEKKFDK
jgi:hypothetical protein